VASGESMARAAAAATQSARLTAALAMVAARADASGLHAELMRDGLHGQSDMAEQGQIGFLPSASAPKTRTIWSRTSAVLMQVRMAGPRSRSDTSSAQGSPRR